MGAEVKENIVGAATAKPDADRARYLYFLPLGLLLAGLVFPIYYLGSGNGWDVFHYSFMHGITLEAYGVTVILLIVSLLVVFIGTLIYLGVEFFSQYRIPSGGYGQLCTNVSIALCFLALVLMIASPFVGLVSATGGGPISENSFHAFFERHNIVMLTVFAMFVCVDSLAIAGAKRAIKLINDGCSLAQSDEFPATRRRKIVERAKFVKAICWAQIIFVDAPVVFGAAIISGFTRYAAHNPHFSAPFATPYLHGLATGFLAAHVIVSQLVFFSLNFFGNKTLRY
jgi:hypothetical protein